MLDSSGRWLYLAVHARPYGRVARVSGVLAHLHAADAERARRALLKVIETRGSTDLALTRQPDR